MFVVQKFQNNTSWRKSMFVNFIQFFEVFFLIEMLTELEMKRKKKETVLPHRLMKYWQIAVAKKGHIKMTLPKMRFVKNVADSETFFLSKSNHTIIKLWCFILWFCALCVKKKDAVRACACVLFFELIFLMAFNLINFKAKKSFCRRDIMRVCRCDCLWICMVALQVH